MALSLSACEGPDLDVSTLRQALEAPPFAIDTGWPSSPDRPSASPVAVIAQLALQLQVLAGAQVDFHTAAFASRDEATAVCGFEDETCAQEAGWLAVALIGWFLALPRPAPQALTQRLEVFREHAPRAAINVYTLPMIDAAQERHIPWSRLPNSNYYRLGTGSRQQIILESGAEINNWIASALARNKAQTRLLLSAQGLPVAQQFSVNSSEAAVQAARRIGYPVVIKPPNMKQGIGVHLNLKNDDQVRDAFTETQQYAPVTLVEQYVVGNDYRFLVVGGELLAVARRRPPQVTGDGFRSIAAIVSELNENPLRGTDNRAPLSKIKIDDEIIKTLAEQELTIDDVPQAGRVVPLRRLPNISLGGEPLDVLDQVHPDNRHVAIDAALSVDLAIAGVDFLCPDISRSYTNAGGVICEVNAIPGLDVHFNVPGGMTGVAGKIVDFLVPEPAAARIPIIVAPGQTELIRQLADACAARGHRPGSWIEGRAIISNRVSATFKPPQIADLLHSPLVDVACLAPEPGSLIDDGLGFDRATWAVLQIDDIPLPGAALLASYCDKVLLPEGAAVPEDWPSSIREKIVNLPAACDPVSWLAEQVDTMIDG